MVPNKIIEIVHWSIFFVGFIFGIVQLGLLYYVHKRNSLTKKITYLLFGIIFLWALFLLFHNLSEFVSQNLFTLANLFGFLTLVFLLYYADLFRGGLKKILLYLSAVIGALSLLLSFVTHFIFISINSYFDLLFLIPLILWYILILESTLGRRK